MKNVYDLLSGLYTDYNDNNLAAYEIRLQVNKSNPSEVTLSWDNYEVGFVASATPINPADLPNWAIKLLHKHAGLWAAECSPCGPFCTEGGTFDYADGMIDYCPL